MLVVVAVAVAAGIDKDNVRNYGNSGYLQCTFPFEYIIMNKILEVGQEESKYSRFNSLNSDKQSSMDNISRSNRNYSESLFLKLDNQEGLSCGNPPVFLP